MDDERLRCAQTALRQVPGDYLKVDAAEVAGHDRGHSFHQGMHVGWAWGQDDRGRPYLDFLLEHRHPGMQAGRYFTDGSTEPIATPASMRVVSPNPVEDDELERQFFERNSAAYADLRHRGLLPSEGQNVGSQDINEYLLTAAHPARGEPDAAGGGANGVLLGGGWGKVLHDELDKPYWSKLVEFINDGHKSHEVYPPVAQTFKAFELTPYDRVKVVILGQDPYPTPGEAHGLAFSVPAGVSRKPQSLKNIHKILASDLSQALGRTVTAPASGSLDGWAEQGVLLLNTALTVRAGTKADREVHRQWRWEGHGWSTFTDAVI